MNSKQFTNTLLIVYGVPGCGKSTLSKQLFDAFSKERLCKLFEADQLEITIHGLSSESETKFEFNQQYWNQSRATLFLQITDMLIQVVDTLIIIDDDFLLRSQRKDYYHVCQQTNTRYVEILIDLPFETLAQRNKCRTPNKQLEETTLRQIFGKLERAPLHLIPQIILDGHGRDVKDILANVKVNETLYREAMINLRNQTLLQEQDAQHNIINSIHQCDIELKRGINVIMRSKSLDEYRMQMQTQFNLVVVRLPKQDIKSLTEARLKILESMRKQQKSGDTLQQIGGCRQEVLMCFLKLLNAL